MLGIEPSASRTRNERDTDSPHLVICALKENRTPILPLGRVCSVH